MKVLPSCLFLGRHVSRSYSGLALSPNQMEFRIFFPVLQPRDCDWLPEQSIRDYNLALNSLDLPVNVQNEVRSDQYFVTPSHVGLKFRHGEKLEIKIRDKVVDGIERWSKAKLGKDVPSAYRREIAGLLRHFGHSEDVADLSFDKLIELKKSRRNVLITNWLSYEACHLELPQTTPTDGERAWFSVAIEGDHTDITAHISSPEKSERFRSALRCIHNVLEPAFTEAATRKCIPVVSGYPLFVRYITDAATAEEVQRDVVDGWTNLVKQLQL